MENGQTRITLDRLQRIAELLDTPIEDFLNDADQITVNMRNERGTNGYNVVQHHQASSEEVWQRTIEMMAELIKEQQRLNGLLSEHLGKVGTT